MVIARREFKQIFICSLIVMTFGCTNDSRAGRENLRVPVKWSSEIVNDINRGNISAIRIMRRSDLVTFPIPVTEARMAGSFNPNIFEYECKIDPYDKASYQLIVAMSGESESIIKEDFDLFWSFIFLDKHGNAMHSVFAGQNYDNVDFQYVKYGKYFLKIQPAFGKRIDAILSESKYCHR